MGKLPLPVILFKKKDAVYAPGDVIEGKVGLKVEEEDLEKVKGIWVNFAGIAKVEFTTSNPGPRADEEHEQTQEYFNSTVVVVGTGPRQSAEQGITITKGYKGWPFKFRLPNTQLPSPFADKYGRVCYTAKATLSIIRPLLNKKNHSEKSLTVAGPTLDLNKIPSIKLPVKCSSEARNLFGLGFEVGTTVTFHLNKRGFVPGEKILITGEVHNKNSKEQRNLTATLIQKTTCFVKEYFNTVEKTNAITMSRANTSIACPKGSETKFTIGPLKLSTDIPSTGMPGCGIIDVQYYVKCDTPQCTETTFDITVGTVPLRAPAPPRVHAAKEAAASGVKTYQSVQAPASSQAPTDDTPPPTYKAAMATGASPVKSLQEK